jgi:hypothetical protein
MSLLNGQDLLDNHQFFLFVNLVKMRCNCGKYEAGI